MWKVKAKMKRKIKTTKKWSKNKKNERIAFITILHLWKVKAKMKRKIKNNQKMVQKSKN